MYPGAIGVVDVRLLADFDPDNFAAKYALDAAFTMLHGSQALILDLRDCAGGSPNMVGYIVGHRCRVVLQVRIEEGKDRLPKLRRIAMRR